MNLLKRLKLLLGYPPPPLPHQIGENIVTMRSDRDCLPVAIANATGKSYEECYKACRHADLPFFLESPIMSNPWNAVRAVKSLGFKCDELESFGDLTNAMMTKVSKGKIIVLVHNPKNAISALWEQHWVVWNGFNPGLRKHELIWGNSQELKRLSDETLRQLFEAGWPDFALLIRE